MEIRKSYKENFRENRSQGCLECSAIIFLFNFALYLHSGDFRLFAISMLSFIVIFVNLYEPMFKQTLFGILMNLLQKLPVEIYATILVLCGLLKYELFLYAGCNLLIYFQMIRGIPKVFTAGEHFINSSIVTSLLFFGFHTFSIESIVIYYTVFF